MVWGRERPEAQLFRLLLDVCEPRLQVKVCPHILKTPFPVSSATSSPGPEFSLPGLPRSEPGLWLSPQTLPQSGAGQQRSPLCNLNCVSTPQLTASLALPPHAACPSEHRYFSWNLSLGQSEGGPHTKQRGTHPRGVRSIQGLHPWCQRRRRRPGRTMMARAAPAPRAAPGSCS